MNSFNAEELEPGWKVKVEEALVKGTEWTQLKKPPDEEGNDPFYIKNEHLGSDFQDRKYLGLHLHEKNGFIRPRPSHFVGARWLDSTTALIAAIPGLLINSDFQ